MLVLIQYLAETVFLRLRLNMIFFFTFDDLKGPFFTFEVGNIFTFVVEEIFTIEGDFFKRA